MLVDDKITTEKLLSITGIGPLQKEILFIENNFHFPEEAYNFREWCIENKIKHQPLFLIDQLALKYLYFFLESADIIVFQSTGHYDAMKVFLESHFLSKQLPRKIIIECYGKMPTYLGIPNIIQSMSDADNPYDNAHMESFFSRFKAEMLEGGAFRTAEDARSEIFEYIEMYYNTQRLHSSIGYLSPNDLENK